MTVGTVTEVPQIYQPARLEYRLGEELLVWAIKSLRNSEEVWTVCLGEKVTEVFALPFRVRMDGILLRNVAPEDVRAWVAGLGDMIVTQWRKP